MLNHQLRNVQKLIMISWHLQNRSVTNSLAAELKSFYKLCTVEAIWYHSSLIWIKISIFKHVHETVLFSVLLNTAAGSVVIWWFGLLHWSARLLVVTVDNQIQFALYWFSLLVNWGSCFFSFCFFFCDYTSVKKRQKRNESVSKRKRVIMVK